MFFFARINLTTPLMQGPCAQHRIRFEGILFPVENLKTRKQKKDPRRNQ